MRIQSTRTHRSAGPRGRRAGGPADGGAGGIRQHPSSAHHQIGLGDWYLLLCCKPYIVQIHKIYTTSADIGRALHLPHRRRCMALGVKTLPPNSPLHATLASILADVEWLRLNPPE